MPQMTPEEVKELLRQVPCPGRSRDVVALGFVKSIALQGTNIHVEFTPDTVNTEKVQRMEDGIRALLEQAEFENIEIEIEPPFDDNSMLLGGASVNPLQMDLGEYGIEPALDRIEGEGARAKNLLSPEPPKEGHPAETADAGEDLADLPPEGPQGNSDPSYDGPLPVFQWQLDPDDPEGGEPTKVKLSIDSWNFVVWWLVHEGEDLIYANVHARHWIYYDGRARPNPAGRTEAVNLVYDARRGGVVAIYGTVKDFRPFVEAFRRAYGGETDAEAELETGSAEPLV